jgi:hypothetical protein
MQPWATLIAMGHKRLETRSCKFHHEGWVCITSSKKMPLENRALAEDAMFQQALKRRPDDLPLGSVVGIVKMHECIPTEKLAGVPVGGKWAVSGTRFIDGIKQPSEITVGVNEHHYGNFLPGRQAIRLTDAHEFDQPVECRGKLSIWEDTHLEAKIISQLETQMENQPDGVTKMLLEIFKNQTT